MFDYLIRKLSILKNDTETQSHTTADYTEEGGEVVINYMKV